MPQIRSHVRSYQAAKRRREKKRENKTKRCKAEQDNIVSKLEKNLKDTMIDLQKEREAKKVYRTKYYGLQLEKARNLEKTRGDRNETLIVTATDRPYRDAIADTL